MRLLGSQYVSFSVKEKHEEDTVVYTYHFRVLFEEDKDGCGFFRYHLQVDSLWNCVLPDGERFKDSNSHTYDEGRCTLNQGPMNWVKSFMPEKMGHAERLEANFANFQMNLFVEGMVRDHWQTTQWDSEGFKKSFELVEDELFRKTRG